MAAGYYWLLLAAFALPTLWLERRKLLAIAGPSAAAAAGGAGGAADGSSPARDANAAAPYRAFRRNYTLVFTLMTAGDWLQGPYIYALYEHYGFSPLSIGRLFVAGFASAAILGAAAGALADRHGRKKAALCYAAACALSCATKHSRSYAVLLVGRLLGGLATSLLFVAFEAWAVAEHRRRGFEQGLLADLFTRAVLLGNGVGAVAAGLAGHGLVTSLGLGVVAPFDLAVALLAVGAVVVWRTWGENYGGGGGVGGGGAKEGGGDGGAFGGESGGEEGEEEEELQHHHHLEGGEQHHRHPHHHSDQATAASEEAGGGGGGAMVAAAAAAAGAKRGRAGANRRGGGGGGGAGGVARGALSQLRQALAVVRRDERVALLGAMQALFESSMYAFVFLWTPALGQTARRAAAGGGGGGGGSGGNTGRGGWGGGGEGAAASTGDNVDEALPHGLIFAIFMLASMLGAAIAGRLMESADRKSSKSSSSKSGGGGGGGGKGAAAANAESSGNHGPSPSKAPRRRPRAILRVESYMQAVYAVSALSMAVPAACHWLQERAAGGGGDAGDAGDNNASLAAQLIAFCVFEVATGAFWPSMMRMRAQYLPEAQRSTLMALFRAPLSAAVCLLLWRAADVPLSSLFGVCAGLLMGACACQRRLAIITAVSPDSGAAAAGGATEAGAAAGNDEEEGGGLVVVLLNGAAAGGGAAGR